MEHLTCLDLHSLVQIYTDYATVSWSLISFHTADLSSWSTQESRMLSPANVGTAFDFSNLGPQAYQQIALETTGFLSDPNNFGRPFCDLRDNSDVALPYSHRTFSDVFDPEHGRLPQTHGESANLQDLNDRGAGSRGVVPDLGDQEYEQMPVSIGFISNSREQEYNPMLDKEGFLLPYISESGCSTLPANRTNRNQIATTSSSGMEYNGSVSSRLADPGSLTFVPQAIDSSLLVFDSSMRAMVQRRRNRKSQAAKDAARHLRRTGGACPRHKASKKKVSQLI
jgi:hypothetical protein